MEAVGAAASIATLLAVTSKTIKAIHLINGATKKRKRLRDELRAIETILKRLTDEINDADEALSWRETIAALEVPGGPFSRLQAVLAELRSKLPAETGASKTISSLKWPFKEDDVKEALVAIEREKSLIHLALSNDSRKLIQEIKADAKKNQKTNQEALDRLLTSITDEATSNAARLDHIEGHLGAIRLTGDTSRQDLRHRQILEWLSPIDHTTQYNDFIRRREAGSGAWLLESSQYEAWVKGADPTLFCPGIPGAGKTIITSVVIQDLLKRSRNDPDIAVAFLYCNFNRHAEQSITDLLGIIARQLLQQTDSMPSSLMDHYTSHENGRAPLLVEAFSALEAAVQLCKQVFVVVDALDECQRHTRMAFMKHILEFQSKYGIKLFITSRFLPEISDVFRQKTTVEIRANETDLRLFLNSQMSRLPFCVQSRPELQQEIQKAIIEATRGMFLLAQLHIQSLEGMRSARAVKTALGKLAGGTDSYHTAYDAAMLRIKSQNPDQAELALQVLSWVARSGREITAEQLQTALAIKPGDQSLDIDDMPDLEDMLSVCAGLVLIVEGSRVVRLVHYTTQEYFDRTWSRWFPDAENEMGIACVTYLLFRDIRSTEQSLDDDNGLSVELRECYIDHDEYAVPVIRFRNLVRGKSDGRKVGKNTFYKYAAESWVHHARDITKPWPQLTEFLSTPKAFRGSFEVLFDGVHDRVLRVVPELFSMFYSYPAYDELSVTATHLIAAAGLHNILQHLPGRAPEIDARDNLDMTPLMHAAYAGHLPMVTYLLQQGADHTLRNRNSDTALSLVCKTGNMEILEALLQAGPNDLNQFDLEEATLLSAAVELGHLSVVERLLATGKFDVDSDLNGTSPLVMAASRGNLEMCRVLLDKGGASVNQLSRLSGIYVWTPAPGPLSIPDVRTTKSSPLMKALQPHHWPVVKFFLGRNDVQVDLKDDQGNTALHVAVQEKNVEIIRLLIDAKGADVNARNKEGLTPLFLACFSSSVGVVEALLAAKGIEPDARDFQGRSVLSRVVSQVSLNRNTKSDVEIMTRLLATNRVDVNSTDLVLKQAPLHHAARMGNIHAVEQLLQSADIDPGLQDGASHTALLALVPVICHEVLEVVRGTSSKAENIASLYRQQLKIAAIVSMSLEASASDVLGLLEASETDFRHCVASASNDVKKNPNSEFSKLHRRCLGLRLVVRRLLMVVRTEFDRKGDGVLPEPLNCPALVFACENGASVDLVRELLTLGADVNAQDDKGISALRSAVARGAGVLVVDTLRKAGADMEAKDHLGRTALGSIGKSTTLLVVLLLLRHGANVHAKDLRGETPLMKAFRCRSSEDVVTMLLRAGARVDDRDGEGHDVIWHARRGPSTKERRRMIRVLRGKLPKHAPKKKKLILTRAARPKQDRHLGFRREIIRTLWKWTARPTKKRGQGIHARMLKATLKELASQRLWEARPIDFGAFGRVLMYV